MVKLINKLFFATLVLITSSCSVANKGTVDKKTITFDNSLAKCISIGEYSIQKVQNTSLLDFKYITEQSIAYCGCKSALAQYRVFDPHQELATGLIDFQDRESLVITLSNTTSLLKKSPITVSLTCSQPK